MQFPCELRNPWGAWVAQWVKQMTLHFSLSHDLTVGEMEPHMLLAQPDWDSLSLFLSFSLALSLSQPFPHLCSLPLSLKINKETVGKKRKSFI